MVFGRKLSVPPITFEPVCLVTGIDSPVTIDLSRAERPSTTSPSTGTFSPGRTRRWSPTTTERDFLAGSVRRHAARRLGREIEQRADGARGFARAARELGRAEPEP